MTSTELGFGDLDHFIEQPRISGLALSPDGTRLVTAVSVLGPKRTNYVSSLWEVPADPSGPAPRRLTWGADGESGPVFRPDGSLLFLTSRPDPDEEADEQPTALWLLPAGAGEARPFATRPGGVSGVVVAADSGTVVLSSPTFDASTDEDERLHKARKELKVGATLHDAAPFRFWDEFWSPAPDRLYRVPDDASGEAKDLTGPTGPALRLGPDHAITPDGSTVIATWQTVGAGGVLRPILVAIDVATGERRTLLDDPGLEFSGPVISADGSKVAVVAEQISTPEEPSDVRLVVLHLATGVTPEAAPGWDRWPAGPAVWTPDGEALLVAADEHGHAPVFRIDLDGRTVRRLTGEGAFSNLVIARDGSALYALRSAVDSPPTPVRIDPVTGETTQLPRPVLRPDLPGTLTEIGTTAEDGTALRGWLVLPDGAGPESPAPLLLWVHGGPMTSWNSWHWRWNPWLAAARGYAVLLPDPALSTGYGREFLQRGWTGWGQAPYTDVLALTDAAVARDDIDADRTAAMGASFGGYMVNWIAGHTDRFRGIVAHAGIWNLETFHLTTDAGFYWNQVMTRKTRAENSPHHHVEAITTPVLIVHGEKDYRTPVNEGLSMFARLSELNVTDEGTMKHRLLAFPDENHWVLKPQNARIWYETVFAFLAHTVLDEPWQAPELLR